MPKAHFPPGLLQATQILEAQAQNGDPKTGPERVPQKDPKLSLFGEAKKRESVLFAPVFSRPAGAPKRTQIESEINQKWSKNGSTFSNAFHFFKGSLIFLVYLLRGII